MELDKKTLFNLYIDKQKSSKEISSIFKCSEQKINYWLAKYDIKKRSIADAAYLKWNPNGDPFKYNKPRSTKETFLFGVGMGLYWGEGTKSNKHSVRLGNTNPYLIKAFIKFLEEIYNIDKDKLRFGIQTFNDISTKKALDFWVKELKVSRTQFYKTTVSVVRGPGNYKNKSSYGVITVYYNNKKLRDILCGEIEKLAFL